jgi:hypothetical protein
MNWYKKIKISSSPIVYHGTRRSFDNFDMSKSDPRDYGIWFHENEAVARGYGAKAYGLPNRVISAILDIKNPFVSKNRDIKITPEYMELLKKLGFDGVKRELDKEGNEWAVFSPSQIKIIDETNETSDQYQNRINNKVSSKQYVNEPLIRITDRNGTGLLNNKVLNYNKLNDDEEQELIELMNYGLEQPSEVPNTAIFYFTESGFSQHKRLIDLLKKASKNGYIENRIDFSGIPIWESDDGQVAIKKIWGIYELV